MPARPHRAEGVLDGRNTSLYAKTPAHAVNRQAVRVVTKLCYEVGMAPHRMLIHISRSEHRVLDPDDVCFLQADDGLSAFGESATPNHNSPRIGFRFAGNYWWSRSGSNRRPPECHSLSGVWLRLIKVDPVPLEVAVVEQDTRC